MIRSPTIWVAAVRLATRRSITPCSSGAITLRIAVREDVVEANVELGTSPRRWGRAVLSGLPVLQGKHHASGEVQEVRQGAELPLAEVDPTVPSAGHKPEVSSQCSRGR